MTQVQSKFIRGRWLHRFVSAAAVAALASCGGGGGSAPAGGGSAALSLTGTAATSAAIAGRPVEAKCSKGSGNTTSATDGKFTFDVTDGVLPCALRVTAASGTVLHSVATGSGTSAVANINPVTQLVVAALTGADPAAFYSNFSSATASAVTSAGVTAAVTAVAATLQPAGISLSALGNVLTADYTAGNAYGQALDALTAAQTSSGTTLAQLTQTVANTTTVVASTPSATPSLPADLLLKPAASNCSALRSGRYRVVIPRVAATAGSFSTGNFDLNASTLGLVGDDGTTGTLVPAGTCQYSVDGGASQAVVSQAGVLVFRSQESGLMRIGIAFPEQTHTVAELEGTWNSLGMEGNGTAYLANAATGTFNSSGVSTAISYCADVKNCVPVTTTTITRSVNSGGGFTNTYSDGNNPDRIFAYRAGGGEWMLVDIAGGGHFSISTRQRTNDLPTVGAVVSFWNFDVNNQLQVPSALTVGGNTITSVNAATGAYTRDNIQAAATTRPESLVANTPRPGYTLRNAQTGVINSAGATVNVPEFIALPFRGMGLSAASSTVSGVYGLSILQP